MIRDKILGILLWWQGLYYVLTGVWAIVALEHFSRLTRHFGDAFEMHSIAGLAVVVGGAFIWGARRKEYRRFAAWIMVASAAAVVIPELFYFSEIKDTLFLWDLLEEFVVATTALFVLAVRF